MWCLSGGSRQSHRPETFLPYGPLGKLGYLRYRSPNVPIVREGSGLEPEASGYAAVTCATFCNASDDSTSLSPAPEPGRDAIWSDWRRASIERFDLRRSAEPPAPPTARARRDTARAQHSAPSSRMRWTRRCQRMAQDRRKRSAKHKSETRAALWVQRNERALASGYCLTVIAKVVDAHRS